MRSVVCLMLLSPLALADSIPFADGSGAASGTFTFNTGNNQVVSWDLLTTFTGSSMTDVYNSADTAAGAAVVVLSNFSGNEVLSFDQLQPTNQVDELDIVIACHGVVNCLTTSTPGNSFATTAGGTEPCGPSGTFCIQSGEQFGEPEPLTFRYLAAGFVTDAPGSVLTFTLTSSPPPTVPEPGSRLLVLCALAAFGILRWVAHIHRSYRSSGV